jgi:hypothetical protein
MSSRAAEQFARVIVEMAPYADEIVFVGGWVHERTGRHRAHRLSYRR